MLLTLERRLREAVSKHIQARYDLLVEIVIELPRQSVMGDLALPVSFSLAKQLRRPPRAIAQELAAEIPPVSGIQSLEVAGGGYLNARFERGVYASGVLANMVESAHDPSKIIVEHTNINPNKAAHIGHLRNAVLGDTLVRMLRALGRQVEVQNYIDNTGVQVADVVAAFHFLKQMNLEQVRALVDNPEVRFDYYCWDLYAEVSKHFKEQTSSLQWRASTLHALESGEGELAQMGALVADAIVGCHLDTMERLDVAYDLLPRESEILHLKFWDAAFELLKKNKAIYLESRGKNTGCWVMPGEKFRQEQASVEPGELQGRDVEDDEATAITKVIVRSNGTVTYVGKDIAYQLWKFGLLAGKDFKYRKFERAQGDEPWMSTVEHGSTESPGFGAGQEVYNVIDVRQSYLQDVVRAGLEALGCHEQAARSIHFSYEMVALSPQCCAELGIELTAEERAKPYVEVSGRKGLGVKADDLLDLLEQTALEEVSSRHGDLPEEEQRVIARKIAVGALRYFMLRFTRKTVIAFDFQEALAFEGETGPYVQYAAVRARNILRKYQETKGLLDQVIAQLSPELLAEQFAEEQLWQLVLTMSQTRWIIAHSLESGEPAQIARHAFHTAQTFNHFYHQRHILTEEDPRKQVVLLALTQLVLRELTTLMQVMGMPVPDRM